MKIKTTATLLDLAKDAGRDLDDVLVTLWDAGFVDLRGPGDQLKGRRLTNARKTLALPNKQNLISLPYWQDAFAMSETELRKLLHQLGVPMSKLATKLPKGAIARLSAELTRTLSSPPKVISQTEIPSRTVNCEPKPEFPWPTVGTVRPIRLLNLDEVLAIHEALVVDFLAHEDPIDPPGPRNQNIISSAVFRPHTSIGGELKYPTPEMGAAALLHSLVHDHPFHNGNKRTGLVAMLVLLDENGLMLTCHEDDLFRLVLQLAQHKLVPMDSDNLPDREVIAIATWIDNNSRQFERGEKILPFRKLKQILIRYECNFEHGSSGTTMKVFRTIPAKGLFSKSTTLTAFLSYGGDGREIERASIKDLREKLKLDEEHGVDSAGFYQDAPSPTDEFIVKYRKTLLRLGKF